ncbi:translation initiation factor IF-2 [Ruminococcus sp. YE71]|uniref:translation initiation factor IF-2 n=1 Tax=unclassified Ruminococcus TaxID=2608920 RepID=UPI00087F64CF|nr:MULTISPECIES: translation initiation factor IF-2 [unclassified Ruminococcus]SDA22873.1 translation initiation factor IF-2 [Ruminococcus sp. YE78]SFW38925.1 translation initiation factor IF-2 [Ruminococcus sp. YE71]
MKSKTNKIKLSELAKDINTNTAKVIECLADLGGEPKKSGSMLTPEEVCYVMEFFTQNNQVDSFDAYFANNVAPEKPAEEKKPAKETKKPAAKAEPAEAPKPEKKAAPVKEEKKPEPVKTEAPKTEEPKAEEPKAETKPAEVKEEKKPEPAKPKKPEKQKAKKQEHGEKKTLIGKSSGDDKGYTVSEDEKKQTSYHTVDTRGSYVELDKYNEKYDNMADAKQGGGKKRDNVTKKQKITQKSQQRKKDRFSHNKETEQEKLRRLELERARKQQLKVMIPDEIVVSELATRLKVTASEVIKKLMMLGVMASLNEVIDFDTAALVAEELGAKVEHEVIVTIEERLISEEEDAPESLKERCPVVVVMGHVDHGKTSILDRIRNAHIADGEAGGITQHIGAYQVYHDNRKITFLDTPGHEAFTSMRARGADITDIAVLVVAADDGIMPQTIESINHAKAAGVQVIVAINKMDKEGANPDRIKQQLTEHDLVVEEWGGDVICVPVSAKTGEGIEDLLESILLVADVQELKANPDKLAKGAVIEARLDKGKGPVATLLVQQGTLHKGDVIIAGMSVGRVRTMTNDKGRSIDKAGPSTPVEITGLAEVPGAGDQFNAVQDEKLARELVEQRKQQAKEEQFSKFTKVTLDNLFSQISEGEMKELPIIVKADVQGSVEAVRQSLEKLSNDEVRVRVIHGAVGAVSESDVMLANASNAIIVGFNVRPDPVAKESAEQAGVDIRLYRIIYDAIEEIETAMKGMLAPKFREVDTARVEVRQVYKITGVGAVAGAYVQSGKIGRNDLIRVVRDGIIIADDKMSSLKRFKDDVKEVAESFECGITLEKFADFKEGDIFEAYVMEEYRD